MPTKPPPIGYNKGGRGTKDTPWSTTDFDYHSPQWRKLRKLRITEEPLCRECKNKGVITAGKEVDHILPISQGGDGLDYDNTQTLCTTCHRSKTAKERNEKYSQR